MEVAEHVVVYRCDLVRALSPHVGFVRVGWMEGGVDHGDHDEVANFKPVGEVRVGVLHPFFTLS